MRFISNANDVKENESLVCMRVTVLDSEGNPSIMNIPVLLNEDDNLVNGFTCNVDIVECDDSKVESDEDLKFGSPTDFNEVVEDIEMEFSGCLESFHDIIRPNDKNELCLVPKTKYPVWKDYMSDRLERFSKGLEDEELNPEKFKYIKHNVNIVLHSLIPYQRDKFTKHLEATAMYTDRTTLKIHLAVKEVLKAINEIEEEYLKLL